MAWFNRVERKYIRVQTPLCTLRHSNISSVSIKQQLLLLLYLYHTCLTSSIDYLIPSTRHIYTPHSFIPLLHSLVRVETKPGTLLLAPFIQPKQLSNPTSTFIRHKQLISYPYVHFTSCLSYRRIVTNITDSYIHPIHLRQ